MTEAICFSYNQRLLFKLIYALPEDTECDVYTSAFGNEPGIESHLTLTRYEMQFILSNNMFYINDVTSLLPTHLDTSRDRVNKGERWIGTIGIGFPNGHIVTSKKSDHIRELMNPTLTDECPIYGLFIVSPPSLIENYRKDSKPERYHDFVLSVESCENPPRYIGSVWSRVHLEEDESVKEFLATRLSELNTQLNVSSSHRVVIYVDDMERYETPDENVYSVPDLRSLNLDLLCSELPTLRKYFHTDIINPLPVIPHSELPLDAFVIRHGSKEIQLVKDLDSVSAVGIPYYLIDFNDRNLTELVNASRRKSNDPNEPDSVQVNVIFKALIDLKA